MTLVNHIQTDLSAMPADALGEMLATIGRRHRGGIDVKPMTEQPLGHRADTFVMPNMSLAVSHNTPSVLRGGRDTEFDNQVVMTMVLQGAGRTIFDRWDNVLQATDAVVAWEGHNFEVYQPKATQTLYMQLPRVMIEQQTDLGGSDYVRAVRGRHPAMALLRHYGLALANHDLLQLTTPEQLNATTQHLCDLVALVLGANRHGEHQAQQNGVPAARLAIAKNLVARNLENPLLDTNFLARELGVSISYIRKLFESEGHAVASYIRTQRLNAAMKLLRDPGYAHLRIIEIAGLYGFDDISTFNRAFKRLFGRSPGEARHGE